MIAICRGHEDGEHPIPAKTAIMSNGYRHECLLPLFLIKLNSVKKWLNTLSEITLNRPINKFLYKNHPITHINFSVLNAGIDGNQINNYLNQDF